MNIPRKIGEGTYGCVYEPSLECNETNIDYNNKISKVLKDENAIEELNEYKKITSFDNNDNFILGKPTKCSVKNDNINKEAIRKCSKSDILLEDNMENTSLLIMENGGLDLQKFADRIEKYYGSTNENIKKMELFWVEAYRIILALEMLLKNGIIHHDIKPQNILYSEKQNRINIIDFGLAKNMKEIIFETNKGEYDYDIFHWNFPLETYFYNKKYNIYKANDISKILKSKELTNAINMLVEYTNIQEENETEEIEEMIKNDLQLHNKMIVKSLHTFDSYGVGISFLYVLNKSMSLISETLYLEFVDLFQKMISPRIFERPDIKSIKIKYKNILKNNGLLKKKKLPKFNEISTETQPQPQPQEEIETVNAIDNNPNTKIDAGKRISKKRRKINKNKNKTVNKR
jgi:serine/threonine protein kinase